MNFFKRLIPPARWQVPVIIIGGIFTGLIIFSLYVSRAFSYLGNKPETCINCHIMAPQYTTWFHSAHREKTNCNDCHIPHSNVFSKYYFKAKDGLRHSTIFTLRGEPQVIFIKDEGAKAVHANCIRCHKELITDTRLLTINSDIHRHRTERSCSDCHRETPHGRVNSLSAVPWARVPLPGSHIPNWLKQEKAPKNNN